jgi:hypothetical protein
MVDDEVDDEVEVVDDEVDDEEVEIDVLLEK